MYYCIGIILLCIPAYLSQTDDCRSISNACKPFPVSLPWVSRTSSGIGTELPPSFTSDGFVMVDGTGQNCFTIEEALTAMPESELEITYYATDSANLTVIICNADDGSLLGTITHKITYDVWTTARFPLSYDQDVFLNIIGATPTGESLIINSVTYVNEADEEDGYGGDGHSKDRDSDHSEDGDDQDVHGEEGEDGPDNTEPVVGPADTTDWLTIVIVLSVVSTVLFLIIFGSGFYILGQRRNKTVTDNF